MDISLAYTLHKLVFSMDRAADKVLKEEFGISYQRAYFLFTVWQLETASQQEIATALGYSAASVSTMVAELTKAGHIAIRSDPVHGRKRLVSLTAEGRKHVEKGNRLLDAKLSRVIASAGIDEHEYLRLTQTLYDAIITPRKDKK
jgi:DNA-binding MarR family transcriptional regulator